MSTGYWVASHSNFFGSDRTRGRHRKMQEIYFKYWEKADPKYEAEPKWYPPAYHCLDVAAVAVNEG